MIQPPPAAKVGGIRGRRNLAGGTNLSSGHLFF
jgi:hypothetical protein